MSDIIDRLNNRIERNKASERELARIVGTTVEAMDAETTQVDLVSEIDFNAYNHQKGITWEREPFHLFLQIERKLLVHTLRGWDRLYGDFQKHWTRQAYIDRMYARDAADTQADSLGTLF